MTVFGNLLKEMRVLAVSIMSMTALFACSAHVAEEEKSSVVNNLAVEPSPAPTEARSYIAELTRFKPTVNYRRKEELTWQPVEAQLGFARKDALQTQTGASAEVRYNSGSTITLKENTLVVIDDDFHMQGKNKEDRAYLRVGKLEGRAKRELWLLTTAGLVKLKPAEKSSVAVATLSSKADQGHVKLTLQKGQASVISRNPKGNITVQSINISTPVELPVTEKAAAPSSLNPDWEPFLKTARTTKLEVPKIQRLELLRPADQEVLSSSEVTVEGKLDGTGGKVLINGKLIPVDAELFKSSVSLIPGANVISIQLIRDDGTTEFKRITVIRKSSGNP